MIRLCRHLAAGSPADGAVTVALCLRSELLLLITEQSRRDKACQRRHTAAAATAWHPAPPAIVTARRGRSTLQLWRVRRAARRRRWRRRWTVEEAVVDEAAVRYPESAAPAEPWDRSASPAPGIVVWEPATQT